MTTDHTPDPFEILGRLRIEADHAYRQALTDALHNEITRQP